MKRLTPDELKEILNKHAKWLQKEEGEEEYNSIHPHAALGNKTPYEFSSRLETVYL